MRKLLLTLPIGLLLLGCQTQRPSGGLTQIAATEAVPQGQPQTVTSEVSQAATQAVADRAAKEKACLGLKVIKYDRLKDTLETIQQVKPLNAFIHSYCGV